MIFSPHLDTLYPLFPFSKSELRLSHPLFYQSLLPTGPSLLPQGYRMKKTRDLDGSPFSN